MNCPRARDPKGTKIYMVVDSNARLGAYSQDAAINVRYISNKNTPLFLGILDFTGMSYINNIFECGVPTYEIAWKNSPLLMSVYTVFRASRVTFFVLNRVENQNEPKRPQKWWPFGFVLVFNSAYGNGRH